MRRSSRASADSWSTSAIATTRRRGPCTIGPLDHVRVTGGEGRRHDRRTRSTSPAPQVSGVDGRRHDPGPPELSAAASTLHGRLAGDDSAKAVAAVGVVKRRYRRRQDRPDELPRPARWDLVAPTVASATTASTADGITLYEAGRRRLRRRHRLDDRGLRRRVGHASGGFGRRRHAPPRREHVPTEDGTASARRRRRRTAAPTASTAASGRFDRAMRRLRRRHRHALRVPVHPSPEVDGALRGRSAQSTGR